MVNNMLKRLIKHLSMSRQRVHRRFPTHARKMIEQTIKASERLHSGELRVVIEAALDPIAILRAQSARGRALELFAQLGIWDCERNNGVLIYVLVADQAVEIVADRGIDRHVGEAGWGAICRAIERAFAASDYQAGLLTGIEAVTQHLIKQDAELGESAVNELSDSPLFL